MDNYETKIDDIIQKIYDNYEIQTLITAFELLVKLFQNIINKPTEDKFKNFKLTNEAIKSKILVITETIDLLKLLGYEKVSDDTMTFKSSNIKPLEFTVEVLNKKVLYLEYKLTRPKTPPKKEEVESEGTYKIKLLVYDISNGMAKQMSPMLIGKTVDGIYHTGLVVYGIEFYYGGGICQGQPKKTPYGYPIKEMNLGSTEIPKEMFLDYLKDIKSKFSQENYHVLNNNCNHFTNDIAFFLTGNGIPDNILSQHKELMGTKIGQMILPMLEQMNVPKMIEGRR